MTIDTSREAVEQINKELSWDDSLGAIELINALLARAEAAEAECVKMLNEQDRDYNRKTNDLIERHADQITFLLAERDAALAELDRAKSEIDSMDAECDRRHQQTQDALAEVARLATPPDALALVAAAYRDAANIVTRAGHSLDAEILARTHADAKAALTAIERAAYERGVQSALQHIRTWMELEAEDRGEADAEYPLERQCAPILALLTQEGR